MLREWIQTFFETHIKKVFIDDDYVIDEGEPRFGFYVQLPRKEQKCDSCGDRLLELVLTGTSPDGKRQKFSFLETRFDEFMEQIEFIALGVLDPEHRQAWREGHLCSSRCLRMVRLREKLYYIDDRLGELRNAHDPHDRIPFVG